MFMIRRQACKYMAYIQDIFCFCLNMANIGKDFQATSTNIYQLHLQFLPISNLAKFEVCPCSPEKGPVTNKLERVDLLNKVRVKD